MKKILALLLAAMMLLATSAAMAETVEIQAAIVDFDVTAVVPQGYIMTEDRINNMVYLTFAPEDEDKTLYAVSIAYSEEFDGRTINELTEEELTDLKNLMAEDFSMTELHESATEHGTKVYLFHESDPEADSSYGLGFSIYEGYFVTVYAVRGDYEPIAEEDFDLALKILSDIWFVKK